MADDLVHAIEEGLALAIASALSPLYPDEGGKPILAVYHDWPDKNEIAKYVVSVTAQEGGEYQYTPPAVIKITPDASPAVTGTVLYLIGTCDGLPMQIDFWAPSQFARDKLATDLRGALNRPSSATMAADSYDLAHEGSIVLPVAALYGQPVEYEFTPVGAFRDSPESAETGLWRGSWKGSASFSLVQQDTGVVLRKSVGLLSGVGPLPLYSNPRDSRVVGNTTVRATPASLSLTRPSAQRIRVIATVAGIVSDVTRDCTFASDHPDIAAVDRTGRVLAGINAGAATITASFYGITATVPATVS